MQETNGELQRFSPQQVAAMAHPPAHKTPEERREAMRRATTGLRVKVQVTREVYRHR